MFAIIVATAVLGIRAPNVTLHNGVQMPLVAQGTGGDSSQSATEGVALALGAGFRHIDTAHDYADLDGVATGVAAWSGGRHEIFLTTKIPGCGVPSQGLQPPCFDNSVKMAKADIATLGGYVDLLLIHFPPIEGCELGCSKIQQQWAALESLYAANLTRAIGVSNMCPKCLDCIISNATTTPMVNQVQYHVGMGGDPGGLVSYCAKHGIVVEAYSPLAHGKVLKDPAFAPMAQGLLSKYHWNSTAQVALAWIAQKGHAVVTKASNPTYLEEDLDLFAFEHVISATDLAAIDALTDPACVIEAPGGCCK
eukprot:m.18102 g.18102  ORF g.18102 m.18102 type:complete len:308 (-) comp11843_c0_seq1:189-1112(-)